MAAVSVKGLKRVVAHLRVGATSERVTNKVSSFGEVMPVRRPMIDGNHSHQMLLLLLLELVLLS